MARAKRDVVMVEVLMMVYLVEDDGINPVDVVRDIDVNSGDVLFPTSDAP